MSDDAPDNTDNEGRGARPPQTFQGLASLRQALQAVRAVLASRHHFDPKDDKATPTWDTVEDSQEIMQFGTALQMILGIIGAMTLG